MSRVEWIVFYGSAIIAGLLLAAALIYLAEVLR